MANNRLVFEGLDELRAALLALPANLASEADEIVKAAASAAMSDMHYPERTGDLADHLQLSVQSAGPFGASVLVTNTSKLAYIFENGTQARHDALGANRGSMPPGHVFVPPVVRRRREMYENLKAMLVRFGLVVSGQP